jgi:hypothetical protein
MNILLGRGPARAIVTLLVAAAPLTVTACGGDSTSGSPSGSSATTTTPSTGSPTTGSPTTGSPTTGTKPTGTKPTGTKPATTSPARVDPVSFFRGLEPVCRAHAQQTGNPVVEASRFSGATLIRDLGAGAYLIQDGSGTRLVVKPKERTVLPETGKATDVMPMPYEFGCPADIFVGATHD